MRSPTLGSRPGIHCWRNSTAKERARPASSTLRQRMPSIATAAPNGMKSSRFWITSATASSPEVSEKLQPAAIASPVGRRVAMQMAVTESARSTEQYALLGVSDTCRSLSPPVIAISAQGQLDHAVGRIVAHLAVGADQEEVVELAAAGADDELADAARRVEGAGGRLRSEALIGMIVPVDHDVGVGIVQGLPQRLRCRGAAVLPGGEARVVPVGEGAASAAVQDEVVPQPAVLR